METLDQAKLMAETVYLTDLEEYHRKLKDAESMYDQTLRDPVINKTLGLPEVLPESTINILKQTRALSLLGSRAPSRAAIYARYGVKPDKE